MRSVSLLIGATLVGVVIVAGALSALWTPYDTTLLDIAGRFEAPSAAHWFGVDQLGRDVFSLVIAGARNSIWVSLIAVAIGIAIGVPAGLVAAARGGWIDEAVMRASDIVFAFPALLLAILLTATLGPSATNAMLAIGVFNIPVFARVARGGAMAQWSRDFVLAARVAGKGRAAISVEHVLPNIADQLIVQATLQFSLGVLAEAGLSYVGLGAQPPVASWGRMLAEAQTYALLAPWLALAPGLAIFLSVLGLNLLGDGLRDRFDPRGAADV